MKVPGKLTKTEGILLLLGVLFLAALAALYVHMSETAEGTDYTITTARRPEEPVTPEPAPLVDVNTASLRSWTPSTASARPWPSGLLTTGRPTALHHSGGPAGGEGHRRGHPGGFRDEITLGNGPEGEEIETAEEHAA